MYCTVLYLLWKSLGLISRHHNNSLIASVNVGLEHKDIFRKEDLFTCMVLKKSTLVEFPVTTVPICAQLSLSNCHNKSVCLCWWYLGENSMLRNGCVIVDYISQDTERNTRHNGITKSNLRLAKLTANTVKDSTKSSEDNDCLQEHMRRESCMKYHFAAKRSSYLAKLICN